MNKDRMDIQVSETREYNPITEGKLGKEILLFTIPIMIGTLFQQLYNAVDAMVIGRFAGTIALASVGGSSGMIINTIVGFFTGISGGVTVVLAQRNGAGDEKGMEEAIHTAAALGLVGGILLGILGFAAAPWGLKVLNTPEETYTQALLYVRIYFSGLIFVLFYNIGSAALRALGDTKSPLYYLIACCFINIGLDLLLVIVFHMGVAGAAIATVFAQAVSAVLVFRKMMKLNPAYRLEIRKIRFHGQTLKETLRLGLPTGIQTFMNLLSGMVMTSGVNSFGANAVAGNTAYAKLDGIYWMVSGGFAVAVSTFVGQNYGAKKKDRVKKTIYYAMAQYMAISIFLCVFFWFTSQYLLYLFTDDPAVIEQGLLVMRAIAPYYWLVPIYEVLISSMRGAGNVTVPTILNILGLCGVRTVWVLWMIAGRAQSVYDVIISCPVSWVVTLFMILIYYFASGRKSIRMEK